MEIGDSKWLKKNNNNVFVLLRSAIHSVQPIELNFTESPTDGSAGNTIQISMDCITMHEPDDVVSVSMSISQKWVLLFLALCTCCLSSSYWGT